jgi:glycerol-3-phosphate acyltransferase PlsY
MVIALGIIGQHTGFMHDIPAILAVLAATLGHMFSPFMGFKGGKGIATAFGGTLSVIPWAGLMALAAFIILLLATRIVSVGSLAAAITVPVWTALFYTSSVTYIIVMSLVGIAIIIAHRKNIMRIVRGQEPKISFGDKGSGGGPGGQGTNVQDTTDPYGQGSNGQNGGAK